MTKKIITTENINKIKDESGDRKYFTIVPRLVWALCRSPYDFALWCVIKDIAGEGGECYLSTEDLAKLAMMSTGKVSDCRRYLMDVGLISGDFRKDPGYPQPVWHLAIPDLWSENVEWCEKYPGIADRIEYRESLHLVKPSPDDGGVTSGDGGVTPGETKKNSKKNGKNNNTTVVASPCKNEELKKELSALGFRGSVLEKMSLMPRPEVQRIENYFADVAKAEGWSSGRRIRTVAKAVLEEWDLDEQIANVFVPTGTRDVADESPGA